MSATLVIPRRNDEPYRLYNLDVFACEMNSHLGIYGSVPFAVAHKQDRTLGVFWLNASDSFVHVNYSQVLVIQSKFFRLLSESLVL